MLKVLIVDDEVFVRKGLRVLIDWKEQGAVIVGEAENGKQALKMIEAQNPDLVITDVKMPVMDGISLIRSVVEEQGRNTKFVILSGYNEFEYARMAMKYGVKDYILKPIEEELLIRTLREIKEAVARESSHQEEHVLLERIKAGKRVKVLIEGEGLCSGAQEVCRILGFEEEERFACVLASFRGSAFVRAVDPIHRFALILDAVKSVVHCEPCMFEDKYENMVFFIGSGVLRHQSMNLDMFLSRLEKAAAGNFDRRVTFHASDMESGISHRMVEAYNKALLAQKFYFFYENGTVSHYGEFRDKEISCDFDGIQVFNELAVQVENDDVVKIREMVECVFREVRERRVDPDVLKLKLNNYIFQVANLIAMHGGKEEPLLDKYNFYNFRQNAFTLSELKETVRNFSLECATYIQVLQEQKSRGIVDKIKKFVDSNYIEDITLKKLSESFYVNPVYLGQLFRNKYGVKFSDYLHQLRVGKAKELLKRSDMTVEDISRKVGYKKTAYFIQIFTELVSQTPSQYRKQKTG